MFLSVRGGQVTAVSSSMRSRCHRLWPLCTKDNLRAMREDEAEASAAERNTLTDAARNGQPNGARRYLRFLKPPTPEGAGFPYL
jgi:hypothetical protein